MMHSRNVAMAALLAVHTVGAPLTAPQIFWTDEGTGKIQRANLDGSNVTDIVTGVTPSKLGLAVDPTAEKLYFADLSGPTSRIRRSNLDGSDIEDLIDTGADAPDAIILDRSAGHMYWSQFNINFGQSRIRRADFDGTNIVDIVTGLTAPVGLGLYPAGGKIYWSHAVGPHEIERANLDGTGFEPMAIAGVPFGLAIDLPGEMVYWADFGDDVIERANLEVPQGETANTRTDIIEVVSGIVEPRGLFLDVDAQHIYWTDMTGIHRIDFDGANQVTLVSGLDTPGAVRLSIIELPPCPPDINGDGVVNVLDLIELLLCFGQPATPPCDTGQDVNGDGTINVLDLIELLLAFGQSCP